MTAFLLYIARSGLYLSIFHAFYLLVMRGTTFFRLNRTLLLAGSYLCLILPVIRLRSVAAAGIARELTFSGVGAEPATQVLPSVFPWKELLLGLYAAGAAVTLALYLISAWKMGRLIGSGQQTEREGCRLVILEEEIPSFSWGRKVVMSRTDLERNPAIFTHEQMHVRHAHSLDMVLFLPLQLLFWWNPLVWITREELRLLHEYEADESVIQKGIDATQYQLLLVRKAVGEQRFSLASGFQHAQLKKRITMMLKPTSSSRMRWSYLALIPLMAVLMFACNPKRSSKAATAEEAAAEEAAANAPYQVTVVDEPQAAPAEEAVSFDLIEQKPTFNGGDANEFAQWVNSQLAYPEEAKKEQAQGRLVMQFTVGADGSVRDVKVLRGVHESLDAEAVRVVSASPKWTPGLQDGKPVPVKFTFPIVFKLQ